MRRAAPPLTVCFAFGLLCGCSPELGDAPFACSAEATCPEGYTCQASVCTKAGTSPATSHGMRSVFINSGEMFWLEAKNGGAELVINDGFTPGARGIYAIAVGRDGKIAAPKAILPYGGEIPQSSSAFELSDGRYGIVTISFPNIDGDNLTLSVLGVERGTAAGAAPSTETLYTETEPFLGGTEPPYVSAIAEDATIDIAWTRPSMGGQVEVVQIAKKGSLYQPVVQLHEPLPDGVLPLSGDCLIWKTGPDLLTVRVGYEKFAVTSFDLKGGAMGAVAPFQVLDDIPIYAWQDRLLLLRYGESSPSTESSKVSYVLRDTAMGTEEIDDGGVLQDLIEPYSGEPSGSGAIFGPLSEDPAFPVLWVAQRTPTQKLTKVASVTRMSSDKIYSARAFESGGTIYFAWTEFHESLMDLWIAVATPTGALAGAMIRPPERVASFPINGLVEAPGRRP